MDFAAQLNVSLANGWGIVRTVTDMCMKQPEGKYVLVKDPNKVRLLSLIAVHALGFLAVCYVRRPNVAHMYIHHMRGRGDQTRIHLSGAFTDNVLFTLLAGPAFVRCSR